MMRVLAARLLGVAAFVALWATTALAQDYTVVAGGVAFEAVPSDVQVLALGRLEARAVDMPFEFPYYGRIFSKVWVCRSGFLQFTTAAQSADGTTSSAGVPLPRTDTLDGIVAVRWVNYSTVTPTEKVGWWVRGTAPDRRFVVVWDRVPGNTAGSQFSFQAQFFESTGRIAFAYDTTVGPNSGSTFQCGFDAFGGASDLRFTIPENNSNLNTGYPAANYQFLPRAVTFTGRLLIDRVSSDASGIGGSILAGRPMGSVRLELRRENGIVANTMLTAADGTFAMSGFCVPTTLTGSLIASSQNAACRVANSSASTALAWDVASDLSFANNADVGTLTLGAGTDPSEAVRAAFNVARVCQSIHEWALPRTPDAIPRLEVSIDPSASYVTRYVPAGASPATMYVGNRSSADPDVWDEAVIARTYGRHLLASIAAAPTTTSDARFNAVTDMQNAFAGAFGDYVWAAYSGTSTVENGTGPSTGTTYDLESPAITVAKGPDVAGCAAGALYDLLDAANEAADTVDGTLVPNRVFTLADGFTVTPTASTFLAAWIDAGFDATSITRGFVGNSVLLDDALEPNDVVDEAVALGTIGVRRSGLVLNRFNDDWFSVTLTAASPALFADMTFDRASIASDVGIEIRDGAGALIATGALVGSSGPIRATSGPVAAGTYRLVVRHLSGATVPAYSVQCFVALEMADAPLVDWTVGRPFDRSLGVAGGIAPYVIATIGSALPPGLSFSPVSQHTVGTPMTPGAFPVTIQLTDGGNPANVVTRSQTITIHDVLKIALPAFVGFPAGKSTDTTLPSMGGTAPISVSIASGGLPTGLAFGANSLRVTGTATTPGSTDLVLDALDVAGSADHVATRAVVSVALDAANAPADLAAGNAACGWWFDAVQGGVVRFSARTAKGRAKRLLAGAVLAPDRSIVTSGSIKAKSGSLAVSKLVCPLSGRYHVIASSDAGDATQLTGSVNIAAPKKGGAKFAAFDPSETVDVAVGVLPGGKLTLKFTGDKKEGLTAKVVGLRDPAGNPVTFASFVTPAGFGGTLTATFANGGTWTVILGVQSASGTPGKLSYSYSVAQPKGAVFVAE